jgi:Peptidase family M48
LENEEGINAFAAGFTPGDAVIGVTRGCIRILSRDELQGVIAHEFSHILNGDMRLNIRLIGVLYGILLISMTGWLIFRSTAYNTGIDTRRNDDDRRGGNPWPLVGLALYVLGYVGILFGNLIKAAVSRQREFLADASAVQFTRNPDGIAGALKKIGALSEGSQIQAPEVQETSHLFFGEAIGHLFSFMATHPPLSERIRRIDPSFKGDFSQVRLLPEPKAAEGSPYNPLGRTGRAPFRFNPTEMIGRIGTFDPQQIAFASQVLDSLPTSLREVSQTPYGARAIVFALLLDRENKDVRDAQLHGLGQHAEPNLVRLVKAVLPEVSGLAPEARLPLADLVVPVLRQLSPNQFAHFNGEVNALIQADQRVSLFEFALQRLLLRHLASHFGGAKGTGVRYRSSDPLVGSIQQILSALAAVGHSDQAEFAKAYSAGVQTLGWPGLDSAAPRHDVDLRALDLALSELDAASNPLKKQVLSACAACIAADGRVTVEEAELIRAIADSLGCPVPIPRSEDQDSSETRSEHSPHTRPEAL